jgi:nucleoside-diphosphate-sugar epimerase
MKILITGGAGFLGAWIARRLLARGHQVRIFDRSSDRRLVEEIVGDDAKAIEWTTGDIANTAEVAAACDGCDSIAHLAALLTPACRAEPFISLNVNVAGTLNVFEAARHGKAKTIVYASSAGVFGPDDGVNPKPTTLYGAYKLACEGIGRAYAADYGIASVGFRPLVVYGPGRETGSTAGVTIACHSAVAGEAYAIPFTGETDLIFVDDVAAAFEAALTRPVEGAHAFTLLGEVAHVDTVISEIARLCPDAMLTAEGPPVPIKAHLAATDTQPVLGTLPLTPLTDGLKRTIEFYQTRAA